ncbi:MAG TPA: alkaline phosphatase family protein [Solirubrobacteraceae bacterium]|nr:alkaline phosphatase family protein [Solirubrobacteraceae bacterium]
MAIPCANAKAGDRPYPEKPVGTVDEQMPFDHIVVVMMENHSFDNLLGDLGRTRGEVDGLSFDAAGRATNSNPGLDAASVVKAFPLPNTAQAKNLTQGWQATHEQIDEGRMDGFVRSVGGNPEPMGYYTAEVLPFAHSLANKFTLANRWFCSVPGPTYPNRRFLLAGTAFGGTATNFASLRDAPPPSGTIFDRLSQHNVSWANYFTDFPMTLTIPSIFLKYVGHHHGHERFLHDCRAGTLPAVSFVDPAMGLISSIASSIDGLPSFVRDLVKMLGPPAQTEEDPDDMYYGESWAYETVEAVLKSPAWKRTLLIYTYDEHGGYYDHVPPPPALPPDGIEPRLPAGEHGAYDTYGPRVPAIVVSPYSRPRGVSSIVYDHTSILATIERKWNLPALTARDANAATVMDCLDLSHPALLEPGTLQAPANSGPSGPLRAGT